MVESSDQMAFQAGAGDDGVFTLKHGDVVILRLNFKPMIEAANRFAAEMQKVAEAAAASWGGFARSFQRLLDDLAGVPRPAPQHLSPFERTLTELERDRCRRINAVQDSLLDASYWC